MRIRLLSLLFLLGLTLAVEAGSAKILKVLPLYVDADGKHALSPSLYERDAYQAFLRAHPDKRSSLEFDVQWKGKAKAGHSAKLILRLELHSGGHDISQTTVLERTVRPTRFFSSWSVLPLPREEYPKFGQLISWRATLWEGDQLLAEQRSFLW